MRGCLQNQGWPAFFGRMAAGLIVCAGLLGTVAAQDVRIRAPAAAPRAEEPPPGEAPARTSSPRDLLEPLGAAEWLDRATDGGDFPPQGDELLWRSLYTVRRLPLAEIDRWQRAVALTDVIASPDKMRGEIIALNGTIVGFTRQEPPAEARERFDLAGYDRCEIEIGPERRRAIVYALSVPKKWRPPLAERVAAKGMFVKLAGDDDRTMPVFVARRIAWYPETPLGDLEMDVGLFDDVASRPGIGASDRECFYQLLAAVGRTRTGQLLRAVPKDDRNAKVEPLFNQPQTQQGRLVELTGTARRAVMVRVEDRDIIQRFGIDHYYEMQVFTSDSQDNPLTFCVRELPRGFPDGDRIIETVRIAGFFFKKWGYRSSEEAEPAKPGGIRRQLAPLLVGREPVWVKPEPADQRFANGVILVLFVVLTVVLWLVVSFLSRSDAKFHRQVSSRFSPSPTEPLAVAGHLGEGNEVGVGAAAVKTPGEEVNHQPPPSVDAAADQDAAALLEVAAREISKEPFADQYRLWQARRGFTGVDLAVLVAAVVVFRLLVWYLRKAGL